MPNLKNNLNLKRKKNNSSTILGLGIDVGGTFTDSVIYNLSERKLVAKAKALTSYHNLIEGITSSLKQLPTEFFLNIEFTVLSTTLATNAMVEGKKSKTGVLVFSPWQWSEEEFPHKPLVNVPGALSITGEIIVPLDKNALEAALKVIVEQEMCSAIVIAGYALQRNSAFVKGIKHLILQKYPQITVISSTEITDELNMYHAAETAVTNLCLIPLIKELISSVEKVLIDFGISSKLMIMKGDGSIATKEYAQERPIETIFSGPAASVIGAKVLTHKNNALILDIGGTTTDCALLKKGLPELLKEGIKTRMGTINVNAIDITTIGLGGDSRIDFNVERKILVGPERAIPISFLAKLYPKVKDFLINADETLFLSEKDAASLDFWVLARPDFKTNSESEKAVINLLAKHPLTTAEILKKLKVIAPCFLPLEELRLCGVLKRAALTPTDLFHIEGSFIQWDRAAAERALEIFSRLFGKTPEDTFAEVFKTITRKLFNLLISHILLKTYPQRKNFENLDAFIIHEAFYNKNQFLKILFQLKYPIVAIGAPASLFIRPLQKHLKAKITVPYDADVANAIGAVASEVVVREKISIIPLSDGNKIQYKTTPYQIKSSTDIKKISSRAKRFLEQLARQKAKKGGLINIKPKIFIVDKKANSADGTEIIIERTIECSFHSRIVP